MASAVLANRYSAAPGSPNRAYQNSGATSESDRFSDNDSSADSRTWSADSDVVSRLTMRHRRARPASSPSARAASTPATSSSNRRNENNGLSSSAQIATASQAGTCRNTQPAAM